MNCPIPQPAREVEASAPRRRALLLTYRFPPTHGSYIASRRAEGLYRHLHHYGWEPVVVTTQNDSGLPNVLAVPDRSYAGMLERADKLEASPHPKSRRAAFGRIVSTAREAVKYGLRLIPRFMDRYGVWSAASVQAAVAYGRNNHVDLVWATLSPLSLGWAAVSAAAKLGVPCVLDFRDPPHDDYPGPRYWLTRAIHRAAQVTVASSVCATPYVVSAAVRPPVLVLSGTWHSGPVIPEPSQQFRIVHAGSWRHEFDAGPLFAALLRLSQEFPEFQQHARLVFIGRGNAYLSSAENFEAVEPLLERHDLTPYEEVQHELRRASVLLIVRSSNFRPGAIGGKLYEYIAFQTPLLSIGSTYEPHGQLVDWIGGGLWSSDVEEIAAFLREHYLRWRESGTTLLQRNPVAVEYLGQQRVAAEFAAVFNAVLGGDPISAREGYPWAAGRTAL